jgi:glycosyltransferase involved in cell wall biosynthesis
MLKVLIVSPHFAPTNAPDMHRVRLLLPHFEKHEVQATVLAVSPECVDFPDDEWLTSQLPASSEIVRVKALGSPWNRVPGLGSVATRSFASLRHEGDRLLEQGQFDLIYFSTTQFGVHLLGLSWKSRFRIPFLMDYQDPWVNDYYREHPDITPPGGRLKFAAADWFNRRAEPKVLRECSGITSVSAAYPKALQARYPDLRFRAWPDESANTKQELPAFIAHFPVELTSAAAIVSQSIFDPNDGRKHWLYAGRCGDYMETSLRGFFAAFQRLREKKPTLFADLCIHFVGTQYLLDPDSPSPVRQLAEEYLLTDVVAEHPERIPYSEVLRCLEDADLLLVPGSDDPGYSASKILPYILSNTPTLGVFHEDSSVVQISEEAGGSLIIPFTSMCSPAGIADRILRQFDGDPASIDRALNREALLPYSAEHQAGQCAEFFRACLPYRSSTPLDIAPTS